MESILSFEKLSTFPAAHTMCTHIFDSVDVETKKIEFTSEHLVLQNTEDGNWIDP